MPDERLPAELRLGLKGRQRLLLSEPRADFGEAALFRGRESRTGPFSIAPAYNRDFEHRRCPDAKSEQGGNVRGNQPARVSGIYKAFRD